MDGRLGSCGELSEWVEGRTWRFEVDDRLDYLQLWRRGRLSGASVGSPEYRAKRRFMRDFVNLLHQMGAHEFARQYEWSTCKSQPNCLKRLDAGDDPAAGLTAVDFRAGLALLPFLPMSPGDVKLILKGLARGSLVQFDRGSLDRLRCYVDHRPDQFTDMAPALDELEQVEASYRDSLIDVTHHHLRLLFSRKLWSGILDATVTGWRVRNTTDDACSARLRRSRFSTFLFALIGWLPTLSVLAAGGVAIWAWVLGAATLPRLAALAAVAVFGTLAGRLTRRLWGRADSRRHYARILADFEYLDRAIRGRLDEKIIAWLRAGRISDRRAEQLAQRPLRALCHLPLSVLPAFLHRLLTDKAYVIDRIEYFIVRPARLLGNVEAREQWLRDMVTEGQAKGMLSAEDREMIVSQIPEPYIQKYLKCLAVHICTLPVTQVVSVAVAIWYVVANPQLSWKEAWGMAAIILFAFQVVPVSPGSFVRGLYVLYLVIRERNFKDYNIAVFLGFFKYIGYLAFPIQMTYHYSALARFMAGHWATDAVHFVPVFGERGALLEHGTFNLFYNYPLTLRRRMGERARKRQSLPRRSWHIVPCVLLAAATLALLDLQWARGAGPIPHLRECWWMVMWPGLLAGMLIGGFAGSAGAARRIVLGAVGGVLLGLIYAATHPLVGAILKSQEIHIVLDGPHVATFLASFMRRGFFFTVTVTLGAILEEILAFDRLKP